jgi:hypothetical protein
MYLKVFCPQLAFCSFLCRFYQRFVSSTVNMDVILSHVHIFFTPKNLFISQNGSYVNQLFIADAALCRNSSFLLIANGNMKKTPSKVEYFNKIAEIQHCQKRQLKVKTYIAFSMFSIITRYKSLFLRDMYNTR